MLRARNQAARRPSTCCAHATKQPAGHHRVARTQPSSPQAANVLRARNPKQPAGRQRVASTHATLSSPQAANVLQAGTLLQLILFALKYILECMDLIYRQKNTHNRNLLYCVYDYSIPFPEPGLLPCRAPQGYRRARSLEPKLTGAAISRSVMQPAGVIPYITCAKQSLVQCLLPLRLPSPTSNAGGASTTGSVSKTH